MRRGSSAKASGSAGRAKARLRLGDRQRAVRDFEEALSIATETRDRENGANWHAGLGSVLLNDVAYQQARERYERALGLFESLGTRNFAAIARLNLAAILAEMRDYPAAIEAFKKSASELGQLGNKVGQGTALGNLGHVYLSLGKHGLAVEQFDEALRILTPILGDQHPTVQQINRNWSHSMQQRLTGR
jgi:tetratricopeptide (TPR) repeat protein